ncbi:MAG: TIR domain-containing protein [Promethearchaeota archaeon]
MNISKFLIIRIVYGVILALFITLAFFPYFSVTYTYGPHSYTEYSYGFFELLFGGWVGIGLIGASVILLNSQKIIKPILFGISGSVIILINLIIRTRILGMTLELSYYVSIVLLISLFAINILSFVYRETKVVVKFIPKKKRIKIEEPEELEIDWEKRKEEEAKQILKELQLKMIDADNLIKEQKIKVALKSLNKIKAIAKNHNLIELLDESKSKIIQCKELESEIKRRKKQLKVKGKLEKRISNVEVLIEDYELTKALENLIEIKQIAKTNEISDLLGIIEDRIRYCKSLETDTVNRIKNTILNYATKLTRLELVDISEKSGIKDENLIENVILGMIRNKEINAEYFSSSKSIAFYKEEKEAVPKPKLKEEKVLKVFLSYSTLDADHFRISDIVNNLEEFSEIGKVSYWQADSKQNIVEFMEETLKDCDVFVLFCSENSRGSKAVKDEWQAAFQMRKKGLLKIIPVYEEEELIPVLLWQMLNVKFTKDNFDGFIQRLYEEILR